MKSRRQGDRLVKSRRYKEPSKMSVVNGRVYSESFPIDLVIDVLSRLSAKSIAKCRCVSKLWASILRRPDLMELFLTRSQARPQLLFTCHNHEIGELFFFSSPQPQYSDENSFLATASYRMKIPFKNQYERILHVNGLVFLRDERILEEERKNRAKVSTIICNPSTGQSLVLPKMKTSMRNGLYSYFGYDPIEKQFKVSSIIPSSCFGAYDDSPYAYQVLTLGTKKMSWRKVGCCIPHFPIRNVICVKGVLYYQAIHSEGTMIVCFDIRSEKFCFLKVSDNITKTGATLINLNGKLGSLVPDGLGFSRKSTSFVLWILEDTEKHEWSKHIRVLPLLWKDVVIDYGVRLEVVGMVGGNEIVFSTYSHSLPSYVFYYNMERNTIRRVEIKGLERSRGNRVDVFLNHVEDIKPIDGY